MLRTLIHYRASHLAVVAGAAVATAVLGGALVVGDSVRGSLRGLTLDRLGTIEHALVADDLFPQDLAGRLAARADYPAALAAPVPVLLLRGAATAAGGGARASRIGIVGADASFSDLFPGATGLDLERRSDDIFPPVAINEALRRELGVAVGDGVLLSVERPSEVPRQSLLGDSDPAAAVETLRLTVRAVLPDRGAGRFSLAAHQDLPLNAFVPLAELARRLGQPSRVNALLLPAASGPGETAREVEAPELEALRAATAAALELPDLGLTLRPGPGFAALESRRLVLRPAVAERVQGWAEAADRPAEPLLVYLANRMTIGGRVLPYSTVAALRPGRAPLTGSLRSIGGEPAPEPGADGILINRWAAEDLEAQTGDEVEMTFYVVGPGDRLDTASHRFQVAGVVALEGLGADPALTPEVPGIADAARIADWEPPFPVDLDLIRPRDEEYWRRFRGAPKAFVDLATGRRLWRSRFGEVTAIRLALAPGETVGDLERGVARRLAAAVPLESLGFRLLPVRSRGLAAATGSTDFSGLFLGFSLFLIVSSLLLVALLFKLAVERRAAEIGTRRALGFPERLIRRRLLCEGGLLAAAGGLVGTAGAVLYAGSVLVGLRSWWSPLMPSAALSLDVRAASLVGGFGVSVLLVLGVVAATLRRLRGVPVPALLAGALEEDRTRPAGRGARWAARGGLAAAVVLLAAGALQGDSSPAIFFAVGAALTAAGLGWFSVWCRSSAGRRAADRMSRAAMAMRSSARNPGRSLLSVALMGCACFVLVSVGLNRRGVGAEDLGRDSGAGGFDLVGETEVPLPSAGTPGDLLADLPAASAEDPEPRLITWLRLRPGEDASCLNLYQPTRPRLLGVPPELVRRGGFRFRSSRGEAENPWELLERPAEPGVIPAIGDYNSVRWILHLGLGDELTMEDDRGGTVRLRIEALLEGSLFQSELLISEEQLLRHFPESAGFAYFLAEAAEDTDTAELARSLEERLGRFGLDAVPAAEKLARYHEVENVYLTTFQALGGLGLLLGTVGLGVVLIRNVLERRRELAVMIAVGFRQPTLAALVVAEHAFLLVTGMAIGTFAGCVAVAPHLLAGGAHVPWASLAATLALVLAVGLLSSLAAVAASLRRPLLPALKRD